MNSIWYITGIQLRTIFIDTPHTSAAISFGGGASFSHTHTQCEWQHLSHTASLNPGKRYSS
jgi:hypothetical protein